MAMRVESRLLALRRGAGMKFGTERARALLDALGSPDKNLTVVHVAGSNGKGAISQYISHILRESGQSVGTFTTPDIYSYFDQFYFNCKKFAPRAELELALAEGEKIGATEFEVAFAAAIYAFFKAGAKFAVVECGMGGLSDATNALKCKKIAVISSVTLEHTAYLGDTIEKICANKLGIVRGCPLIVSALQPPEARAFFAEYTPTFAGDGIKILSSSLEKQIFLYGGEEYILRCAGFAQPYNAACAIEVAKLLNIPAEAIRAGLKKTRLFGRIEVIRRGGTTYILDGGHNPAGVEPLCGVLKGLDAEIIYGCLSDKDIEGVVSRLSKVSSKIIAVQPRSGRAMDGEKIFAVCKKYFTRATYAEGVVEALETSSSPTVAVCGSFTLLKEAKRWIEKR